MNENKNHSNFENHHSPDQDWIQSILIKRAISRPAPLSECVLWALYALAIVIVLVTF